MDKFEAPDEGSMKRMTPKSIEALLETLRGQRAEKVQHIDQEIAFYENRLKELRANSA